VNPGGVLTREKIGFCSGNFEQMVKDVTFLIENDEERISMGKRARAYAEEEHGFEHNAEKIAQFFTEVITKQKKENKPLNWIEPLR
jgi:glycosyltransferase involved in cell wall biosynthesis